FAAVVFISGGIGKLVLGGASDLWRRNRLLASISLVVILSYALFFATSNLTLDLLLAIIMGFFSSAIFPVMQAQNRDRPRSHDDVPVSSHRHFTHNHRITFRHGDRKSCCVERYDTCRTN